ncbi:MAG: MFS transporter [Pseudomonadota bacterium]
MRPDTPEFEKAEPIAPPVRTAVIGPVAANVAFVMELTLLPLLLPAIQADFGLSISSLVWVFNAYGVAVAIGVFLGGWCGDAFNVRKIFGYGVALFALGSLVVALADGFDMLIFGRILQGLGGGIFSPLVPLLLTRASPHRPGRALIFWGSISGYVAAFAPIIYGSFLGQQNWNIAFILIAIGALVALTVQSGKEHSTKNLWRPRGLSAYLEVFRSRNLLLTFLYVFCTYGAITYFLFQLPVRLSANEITAGSLGLVLSILWLTFSGLSTLLRNLVDRDHIRVIMLAAPLLIAAGLPLSFGSENLSLLVLSTMLVGSGLACSNAPSTQMILRFAPKGMRGVSTSLDITFARLGGIATVAVLAGTERGGAAFAVAALSALALYSAFIVSKPYNHKA